METFSTSLALCVWNSLVPGEFPTQRPVRWSFDVFFDLHPNKRWRKKYELSYNTPNVTQLLLNIIYVKFSEWQLQDILTVKNTLAGNHLFSKTDVIMMMKTQGIITMSKPDL